MDQGAVIGLEREAEVELEDATSGAEAASDRTATGSTFPRSRGPSKWPPAIGAVTRLPCGTAPIFCAPPTATCIVINTRDSIRHLFR
jgi:hypothetical protein